MHLQQQAKRESRPMDAWRFSTPALPDHQREAAWREALDQRGIASLGVEPGSRFFGATTAICTRKGFEFLQIASRAQRFSLRSQNARGICMAMVLEGRATVRQRGAPEPLEVAAGQVIFGAANTRTEFEFDSDFRVLFVEAPHAVLGPRLIAPINTAMKLVLTNSAFGRIFCGFLASLANTFETLGEEELCSIESALCEFFSTVVLMQADTQSLGGIAGRRAAAMQKVFQLIEARLQEPELNLSEIAAEYGISVRNLQKLFETSGQNFTSYLRQRRLERCRDDLAATLKHQLSISEICYRWGFSDPAYFSRTFRDQFGLSPREFRKNPFGARTTPTPQVRTA
jgi:AraC-like DNA-binding protein